MTVDWSRNVLHELFLPLVADLSVPQLQLLRTVATAERPRRPDEQGYADPRLEPPGFITVHELTTALLGISDHLPVLLQDFVRRGLITNWWPGRSYSSDDLPLERITMTELGRLFLRFIAEPPSKTS